MYVLKSWKSKSKSWPTLLLSISRSADLCIKQQLGQSSLHFFLSRMAKVEPMHGFDLMQISSKQQAGFTHNGAIIQIQHREGNENLIKGRSGHKGSYCCAPACGRICLLNVFAGRTNTTGSIQTVSYHPF